MTIKIIVKNKMIAMRLNSLIINVFVFTFIKPPLLKKDLVDTQQLNYFSYVMVHHGMLIMLEISKSIVLI